MKSCPSTLRALLHCCSCARGSGCNWHGRITFNKRTRILELLHYGTHGQSQHKRYGTFTTDQLQKWKDSAAKTGVGKLGAFAFSPETPLSAPQSQGRLKRQRKAKRGQTKPQQMDEWPIFLIDREIQKAQIKCEDMILPDTGDNLDVCLLGRHVWTDDGKDRVAYVFSSRAVINTLTKLANKDHVKLCSCLRR